VPAEPPWRPAKVVLVVGTGTEVGKTWVAARLLEHLVVSNVPVAARKPAQSFDADDEPATTDAAVLGRASGEPAERVCPAHRWYATAMAPPMAADALGRPAFSIGDLVDELDWPDGIGVGVVESAGGVRSPQAADGDAVDLARRLGPDAVLLVADAGLGTINGVRLSVEALSPACPGVPLVVALNRFDGRRDLDQRNRRWLSSVDHLEVVAVPGEEHELVGRLGLLG
jgi:dethiobiotin synthetase